MNRKISILTPMLALSMAFAVAGTAQAQSASVRITFGSTPHWTTVDGTQVQVIRQDERPDYDMFRYNNRYYVYRDSRWYQSDQWQGNFNYVDTRSVPVELSRVPRDNWRSYPTEWQSRNDYNGNDNRDYNRNDDRNGYNRNDYRDDYNRRRDGTDATFQVSFGSRPRWSSVPGTRVMVVRSRQRMDYDMFRYGNTYYAYSNDRWYTSDRWDGTYRYIDDGSLPREFRRVPRGHWRHYPQGWQDRRHYDNGRGDDRRR